MKLVYVGKVGDLEEYHLFEHQPEFTSDYRAPHEVRTINTLVAGPRLGDAPLIFPFYHCLFPRERNNKFSIIQVHQALHEDDDIEWMQYQVPRLHEKRGTIPKDAPPLPDGTML